MRDFHLVLVGDCCAAFDQALHDATLLNIRRHFGLVATADEVVAAWPVHMRDDATVPAQPVASR
jgi:nicotinamidase-related amidase